MRDYKDMADAVFRRRDEYVASVKKKQKIALNTCLSLCALCLATFGAFGIWKLGVVKPDPTIIGTTPPAYTDVTEDTKVSIGNNATSEGDFTEQTQLISGNNNGTAHSSTPQEASKPQGTKGTDPAEKVTKPQVKPDLPQLPTLPIGPQRPTLPNINPPVIVIPTAPTLTDPVEDSTDGKPNPPQEVPPTSGDPKPTRPTAPPPWTEAPEATSATDGGIWHPDSSDKPSWEPTYAPTIPAPPDAGVPGEPDRPSTNNPPTEPVVTSPCWTEPMEPTTAVCCTEPTEPLYPETPDVPATEPATETPSAMLSVYGKVVDENGKAVKGAKIGLYAQDGRYLVAKTTTDSNGNYSFTNIFYIKGMYLYQMSAPSGYVQDNRKVYVDTSDHYSGDYIFVNNKL